MTASDGLKYRGNIKELDNCPRCKALDCDCKGEKKSFAVPRGYSNVYRGGIADNGWWCSCCFAKLWSQMDNQVRSWLKGLATTPDKWIETGIDATTRRSIGRKMSAATKRAKLGTEWKVRDNEKSQELEAFPSGKDWPIAGDEVHFGPGINDGEKRYAISGGVASLVKALSK